MSAGEPLPRPCRHTTRVEQVDREPDLLDILGRHLDERTSFYWEDRQRGEALLGLGSAHEIRCQGPGRFVEARAMVCAVLDAVEPADTVSRGLFAQLPPRFVGGFAFSPESTGAAQWREFPPLWLLLPADLWVVRGERTYHLRTTGCDGAVVQQSSSRATARHAQVTGLEVRPKSRSGIRASLEPAGRVALRHRSAPATTPSRVLPAARIDALGASLDFSAGPLASTSAERGLWSRRVERVLRLVEAGEFEKIVLSRSRTSAAAPELRTQPITALGHLRDTRPTCITFCMNAGETCFFGSTPELLARVTGSSFETQALAGTARRGETPREDDANARRLLACEKNRREQTAVVAGIEDALAPVAAGLSVAQRPSVLRLPEALHLHTPITGSLARPTSVLELAALMHPTPAVCGSPRGEAYRFLQREEAERGWYSGGIGWVTAHADGAFAVSLRSALADRERGLTVWAGAGIVAGSRPRDEFEETELKMRAVREAVSGAPR